MKIAVKFGWIHHEKVVDEHGDLVVEGGGMTLVQRLLEMYPEAKLVGKERRQCNGFEMITLDDIKDEDTLVINMDVIDSIAVFQTLHATIAEPKIMNFAWINPSTYHHVVNFAAMGLSFALFPTFCSSARTAGEVREVINKWTISRLGEKAQIAWADLGILPDKVRPRPVVETPIVAYPAIYLSSRKNPELFVDVVKRVHKRVPIKVEMRLAQSHLFSDLAMDFSRNNWFSLGPLTAAEEDYWDSLARSTAFLATAKEEAYGIQYLESLLAGAVGIFPDRSWVRSLLPEDYPFIYHNDTEAEEMLYHAVTNYGESLVKMDKSAGGSLVNWIRTNHDVKGFNTAFQTQINTWFKA